MHTHSGGACLNPGGVVQRTGSALGQPVADAVLVEAVAALADDERTAAAVVQKLLCGDALGLLLLLALALNARVGKVVAADRARRRALKPPHCHRRPVRDLKERLRPLKALVCFHPSQQQHTHKKGFQKKKTLMIGFTK